MKIVNIVGARPQFIKAALLCRQLRENGFREILVHTGQHYDLNMSDVFFKELRIPEPDYHLGIGSGPHGKQTGRMLIEIEQILMKESPDLVIIYGDTNSTLAGSLAAAKLHIPIAHVEAGLRSFNKRMPEEVNRVLADHVSTLLFCPTEIAAENLIKEGFRTIANQGRLVGRSEGASALSAGGQAKGSAEPVVINVGDVMYDMALAVKDTVKDDRVLDKYALKPKHYVLATIHRAENTDEPGNLNAIWESLALLAKQGMPIMFPVHPRTRKAFEDNGIALDAGDDDRIRITEPVSYTDMIALEGNAACIITDSGGVQKEGYFFKVPCVIPRNETEWVELVDSGWNVLTGIDTDRIVDATIRLYRTAPQGALPEFYGDGHSVDRMVDILRAYG